MIKEFRVYVVSADYTDTSAYDIQNWKLYEEMHNTLLQEAKDFIAVAEENGAVYSLSGFQDVMNFEEINLNNSWIYITNNY